MNYINNRTIASHASWVPDSVMKCQRRSEKLEMQRQHMAAQFYVNAL
jgi:hypothetical protein